MIALLDLRNYPIEDFQSRVNRPWTCISIDLSAVLICFLVSNLNLIRNKCVFKRYRSNLNARLDFSFTLSYNKSEQAIKQIEKSVWVSWKLLNCLRKTFRNLPLRLLIKMNFIFRAQKAPCEMLRNNENDDDFYANVRRCGGFWKRKS